MSSYDALVCTAEQTISALYAGYQVSWQATGLDVVMDVSGVAELVAPSAREDCPLSCFSKIVEVGGENCCPTDLIRDQFAGDWSHHSPSSGFSGRSELWQ